ncbi:M23 family metallopeptidase [uncultured Clostridium sp.]|jgi:hypothetical protein|uniref:M23 family metallopeptidase n=1 Tax=uncultured Clostridium sp. TaxID=59620 RepID=UPI002619166F|nr:M23 family metallopeptidase [uncultured Clostridium sp.]
MGKYDKVYEDYYKKINLGKNNFDENSEFSNEDVYNEKKVRKKRINPVEEIIKIAVITTTIPVLFFGGIFMCKQFLGDEGKQIYNHIIKVISTDGYYKDKIVGVIDKDKDSEGEELVQNEIDETLKIRDAKAEEIVSAQPTSFVLDDENVERVKSDKSYSEFVTALDGIAIKAKSEEGLVLSCKFKIIASSESGIIEEVGENAEGFFLKIDHGAGVKTLYYNLPKINYVKNQAIKKGDKIVEVKEARDIVFKIEENNNFVTPRKYLDFIK